VSKSSIPKALYQANIDLALRIAALLQEHGQQWFDLFADEAGARLGQGLAGVDRFRREFSLDRLTSLPADLSTHFGTLDAERWQALLAKAVEHQSRFSRGVQSALDDWQGACSQLLAKAVPPGGSAAMADALAAVPGLADVLASLQPRAQPVARTEATGDAARSGEGGAEKVTARKARPKAASKPAAKPAVADAGAAPARKAASATAAKADRANDASSEADAKGKAKGKVRTKKTAATRFPSPMPALVTTPHRPRKS